MPTGRKERKCAVAVIVRFHLRGGAPKVCGVNFSLAGTKFYYWTSITFGIIFLKCELKVIIFIKLLRKLQIFGENFCFMSDYAK